MIDLYKKNIWNDTKTVNVVADACFSQVPKILATALNFFLGHDKDEADEDDDEPLDMIGMKHTISINKKTKSRKTQFAKAVASIKKVHTNLICSNLYISNEFKLFFHHLSVPIPNCNPNFFRKSGQKTRQKSLTFQLYTL